MPTISRPKSPVVDPVGGAPDVGRIEDEELRHDRGRYANRQG